MALTLTPQIGTITKTDDGSTTQILDSTNYGSPEVERNTKAVYLLAFKVDEELEETALTIETYDPETVTEWVVENTTDGHQKFVLLVVQIYQALEQYEANDVVFYNDLLYRNVSGGNLTGTTPGTDANWSAVTSAEVYALIDTAEEAPNLLLEVVQTVLTFAAQQCLGTIAAQHAKENCGGTCGDSRLKDKFDELWTLIYVANIASTRGKYTEGERQMRMAETYCDCGCD
jgi:hypothetical protein